MHASKKPPMEVPCKKICAETDKTMWLVAEGTYPMKGLAKHRRVIIKVEGRTIYGKIKDHFPGSDDQLLLDIILTDEHR